MSLRRVPWMHMFEWQQVCSDLFSINLEERCRGYEKLLLWKARLRVLPPAIECSLELVYVDLLDKKAFANINAGAYGEREMQMLMSSAVIRFLSFLAVIVGPDKSYTEMLTSLGLPNWLVKLRHHIAHHKDLPSPLLLHQAVNFCLEWLLKNYWEKANRPSELDITEFHPGFTRDVHELFEAWETVNLYMLRGIYFIDQVDSVRFKGFLHHNKESGQDLDEIGSNILKNLLNAINEWHVQAGSNVNEKLCNMVLQSETFIPAPELVGDMGTRNYLKVVKKLAKSWKNVLGPLQQKYSLLPSLIHKLVTRQVELGDKHSSQQLIISQWINVLCCSIIKSCAVSKEYSRKKGTVDELILAKRFDKLNPEWQGGFLAVPEMSCGNFCPRSLVKEVCLKPNDYTSIFLSSLLMVANPVFSNSEKCLIEKLVVIYTKGSNRGLMPSDRVYDLQDLSAIAGTPLQRKFKKSSDEYKVEECELRASVSQWSMCPLGNLPWNGLTPPSLDLPESVKWIEHTTFNCTSQEADIDLTHNSIEKNEVNSRKYEQDYVPEHSTKKRKKLI